MLYEKIKDQEYDIYYFSKMWKIIVSYKQYLNYKKTNAFETYTSVSVILKDLDPIMDIKIESFPNEEKYLSLNKKVKLTKNICDHIENILEEDAYNLILKPVYYNYNEKNFLDAYVLLQDSCDKEIIENLIMFYTDSYTVRKMYCAKNIQLTIDAFGITQSEVDKKISEKKAPVAKLLYKDTREVNINTLEAVAKAINIILQEIGKNNESSYPILKEGYFDSIFTEIQIFNDNKTVFEISAPTYEFYKSENHPITLQDLEKGRIKYDGNDKDILYKYNKYDNDILAQRYKAMKPLERKMIFDFIYVLLYCEYKKYLLKEERLFLKRLKVSEEKIDSLDLSKQPLTPKELYLYYLTSNLII